MFFHGLVSVSPSFFSGQCTKTAASHSCVLSLQTSTGQLRVSLHSLRLRPAKVVCVTLAVTPAMLMDAPWLM